MAVSKAELDDEGMQALRALMGNSAFAVLLALLNWAGLWQRLHEGGADMDGNAVLAMMMPITGVGADPFSWPKLGPSVLPVLQNEVAKWSADEVYRKANTMPWCVLHTCAPALAAAEKGLQFSAPAHQIINRYFTPGVNPDGPDLSDVITAVSNAPNSGGIPASGSGSAEKDINGARAPAGAGRPNGTSKNARRSRPAAADPYAVLNGNTGR